MIFTYNCLYFFQMQKQKFFNGIFENNLALICFGYTPRNIGLKSFAARFSLKINSVVYYATKPALKLNDDLVPVSNMFIKQLLKCNIFMVKDCSIWALSFCIQNAGVFN